MTACLLSAMTMQAANALMLHPIDGGAPEQVAFDDIRHITFVDDVILLTIIGNTPAYYQIGSFSKLAFGEAEGITTDINNPEVQTLDLTVHINSEGEIVVNGDVQVLSLTVISINGVVLKKATSDRLSVSALPTGIYLVKMETTQGVAVRKFIKK